MVDASKRRGCDVCRKRHIKCDRLSPSCTQCIRAGWTCSGYPADLSFVNYTQNFPTGRSKPPPKTRDREIRPAREAKARTSTSPPALEQRKNAETLVSLSPAGTVSEKNSLIPIAPAASKTEILRRQFVWGFEQRTLPAKFETQGIEPYLKYLPQYLGQNQTLDDTVRFLALASSLPPNQRDVSKPNASNRQLIAAYGTSIRGLSEAIGDTEQVNSLPTLAATLLLQLYETWCSQDNPRRAMHANAVAKLMEHRGPEAFTGDFDLAILESEMANALFSSLRAGTSCFLADARWHKVIQSIPKDGCHEPGRYDVVQLEVVSLWTYLPGAVAGFHDFIRARSPTSSTAGDSPQDSSTNSSTTPPSLVDHGLHPVKVSAEATKLYQTLPYASSSTSPHHTQPQSSSTPLASYLRFLHSSLLAWRTRHLPVARRANTNETASGGPLYEMVCEVGSATMIAICCYMMATVIPKTEPADISAPAELHACAKAMMNVVMGYYIQRPDHPLFAAGALRNSLKLAWIKTREHRVGLVTEGSEAIAELVDAVFSK